MWRLAEIAGDSNEIRTIFEHSPHETIGKELRKAKDGARFQAELALFLETFGYRTVSFLDVADVAWVEDPTPVYISVQQTLRGKLPNPKARQEKLAR